MISITMIITCWWASLGDYLNRPTLSGWPPLVARGRCQSWHAMHHPTKQSLSDNHHVNLFHIMMMTITVGIMDLQAGLQSTLAAITWTGVAHTVMGSMRLSRRRDVGGTLAVPIIMSSVMETISITNSMEAVVDPLIHTETGVIMTAHAAGMVITQNILAAILRRCAAGTGANNGRAPIVRIGMKTANLAWAGGGHMGGDGLAIGVRKAVQDHFSSSLLFPRQNGLMPRVSAEHPGMPW